MHGGSPAKRTEQNGHESILVFAPGSKVTKIFVDGARTPIAPVTTPTNLFVDLGIGPIGASESVIVELDGEFTGVCDVTGEKPQAMELELFIVDGFD